MYMAKYEIERKFLVKNGSYKELAVERYVIKQGYLSRRPESTVRVRLLDSEAFLTVKGVTRGNVREEYEYPVPAEDAERMLGMCEGPVIEKVRWIVPYAGKRWEVDEFGGALKGLTLAEIELESVDEEFSKPDFIGKEVSSDPRYFNSNLSQLRDISELQ